jgi:hypothetical protein
MSITGSFNGAQIIAFSERPGIKQIALYKNDTAASSVSLFTGTMQGTSMAGCRLVGRRDNYASDDTGR